MNNVAHDRKCERCERIWSATKEEIYGQQYRCPDCRTKKPEQLEPYGASRGMGRFREATGRDEEEETRNAMIRPPMPDCYEYVRCYYNVPAYVGVRVKAGNKEGVLVRATSDLHYIHILIDGEKHSNPYHPTDGIEYFVEGGSK